MEQYYSPSGKFSPTSFVFWIVAAILILPIFAFCYSYAIWYVPIPYLSFFITAIFGYLIGYSISFVVKLGKIRNKAIEILFCLLGLLVAVYVHWAVWVDLAYNISGTIGNESIGVAKSNVNITEVISLLLQPKALLSAILEINSSGVWSIKGELVSGILLTIVWVIEFLIITVTTLAVGVGQASKPYCEVENSWFKQNELSPVSFIETTNKATLIKALYSGDMETITETLSTVIDAASESHSKITLFDAKHGENYVSITNEKASTTDKGEIKFDTTTITSYLKIPQETADKLLTIR